MSSSGSEYAPSPPSGQPRGFIYDHLQDADTQLTQEPVPSLEFTHPDLAASSPAVDSASDSDPPDPSRVRQRRHSRQYAAERALHASLVQQRAADLSIHLYNAFQLKQRAARLRAQHPDPRGGPRRNHFAWGPAPAWTAWPMPAARVPREREAAQRPWKNSRDRAWTVRSRGEPASSRAVLEEIVIATAAKVARRRFEARGSDYKKGSDEKGLWPLREDWDAEMARVARPEKRGKRKATPMEGGSTAAEGKATPAADKSDADGEARMAALVSGIKPPQWTFQVEHAYLRPAPLSDEAQITALLQRPVRHTLVQLDALFGALHASRVSYAMHSVRSGRGRKRKASSSHASAPPAAGASASNRSPAKRLHSKHAAFPPRDWSDVLGFAALIGWPVDALRRTQARCEALFAQRMDFVTSAGAGMPGSSIGPDGSYQPQSTIDEVLGASSRRQKTSSTIPAPEGTIFSDAEGSISSDAEDTPQKPTHMQARARRIEEAVHAEEFGREIRIQGGLGKGKIKKKTEGDRWEGEDGQKREDGDQEEGGEGKVEEEEAGEAGDVNMELDEDAMIDPQLR